MKGKFDKCEVCNIHQMFSVMRFDVGLQALFHRFYIIVWVATYLVFEGPVSKIPHCQSIAHFLFKI